MQPRSLGRSPSPTNDYLATSSGGLRCISKAYIYIAGGKVDNELVYLDVIGVPSTFSDNVKPQIQGIKHFLFQLGDYYNGPLTRIYGINIALPKYDITGSVRIDMDLITLA